MADRSEKPNSMLKGYLAAISAMYEVLNVPNLTREAEIIRMQSALVKSGTCQTMSKSKVMPVVKFTELFESWVGNEELSIKQLRLKCITLLALSLMLRPSDIAPKGVNYQSVDDTVVPILFTEDQVEFTENGLICKFLGVKNDTSRSGFEVFLPMVNDEKIDPVRTLQCYIQRTAVERKGAKGAVFLTLSRPYKAICSATVGSVLSSAIELAGLKGMGFGPKSFRPTGATAAVALGHDPDKVRKLGRWKTNTVFLEHYVHVRPEKAFTEDVLHFDG